MFDRTCTSRCNRTCPPPGVKSHMIKHKYNCKSQKHILFILELSVEKRYILTIYLKQIFGLTQFCWFCFIIFHRFFDIGCRKRVWNHKTKKEEKKNNLTFFKRFIELSKWYDKCFLFKRFTFKSCHKTPETRDRTLESASSQNAAFLNSPFW